MPLDFYAGMAEETAEVLRRQQLYVAYALKNGDAAYVDKPGEVKVIIRLKKKKDESTTN